MAKTKRAKVMRYVRRVLEDDYVQEQLRSAAKAGYATYTRARKQRAKATEDKRVYRSLRQAATSVRNAATALQPSQPEPKHRVRKFAIVTAAAAATAWLTLSLQKAQSQDAGPSVAAPPPEAPRAPQAVPDRGDAANPAT
jgi:hypothetical protein